MVTYINLPEEKVVDITAELASELSIEGGLLAVTFSAALMTKLEEATDKEEIRRKVEKNPETIRAGHWTIQLTEMPNRVRLIMMFKDHLRVDRALPNKHEALCCAFNILVN